MSTAYPHLKGDLDAEPELLSRLDRLAASMRTIFDVTSGARSEAEQADLYAHRATNPFPVAKPGTSRHETGRAADVLVHGQPIQNAIPAATLLKAGLSPLAGDAVHVDLPDRSGGIVGAAKDVAAGALGIVGKGADLADDANKTLASLTPAGLVKSAAGALSADGPRIVLYIGLVGLGLALALIGVIRATGAKKLVGGAVMTAVTKNPAPLAAAAGA